MRRKRRESAPGMIEKLLFAGVLTLVLATGIAAEAQQVEIPPEDVEIIEMLEMLENMDLLKEDLDLIKDLGQVGGNHAD
jgi:hypothetical protein